MLRAYNMHNDLPMPYACNIWYSLIMSNRLIMKYITRVWTLLSKTDVRKTHLEFGVIKDSSLVQRAVHLVASTNPIHIIPGSSPIVEVPCELHDIV